MGGFSVFFFSVISGHFSTKGPCHCQFLSEKPFSQHIPGNQKNERTLLNHTVIFFKAHSSYINIYINIFLFITNTRQALVTLRVHFVIETKQMQDAILHTSIEL